MDSDKKFYVTTPIYYGTAKPHVGSLYSTLIADLLNRWHTLQGHKTFFLTGTDEHGQKVAQAAAQAQKSPKAFVDSFIGAYQDTWKKYDIEYSYFIRTTDPAHIKAVQQWIVDLQKSGDIYKGTYIGWYCTPCETFVTEGSSDTSVVLCPCCRRPTQQVSEETYFFKLSAYQDRLLAFYEQTPNFIVPHERMQEIISFVKSGLKDLSISRKAVTWGIPFPGDETHVVYVWADALNNYISGVGYGDKARAQEFNFWWPADVQVMGKDIVRFHAVYWPAFLMAANLALPKQLLVHGWLKIGDQKMSKSLGNAVDPDALAEQYGADAVRYYLLRYMAITHDSPFSIADLEQRINTDLANDLGNLLNRMLVLAHKNNMAIIPRVPIWSAQALELRDAWWNAITEYNRAMSEGMFHMALAAVWKFIHHVNSYFHAQEPWKLAQTNEALFLEVISAVCHALYGIAYLLWPVTPHKATMLLQALGKEIECSAHAMADLQENGWNRTFVLMMINPLFKKIEITPPAATAEQEQKVISATKDTMSENTITINDFAKVELRVGLIESCQEVPQSEKLLQLMVDFGQCGKRQILSGIKKIYIPADLINQKAVFVTNLAPRMMMGLESHGMLLLAQDDQGNSSIVVPAKALNAGAVLK